MDGRLHRGGDLAVEEDDAVPRLLGRGHSSTALVHGKGQVRTLRNMSQKPLSGQGLTHSTTFVCCCYSCAI